MPSKEFSSASVVSVRKLLLELEADSTTFVTLRVKQDRRQSAVDVPMALERREALQPTYDRKPVSK